jgi:hypothetical protein
MSVPPASKRPPCNLWSSPRSSREDDEQVTAKLVELKLTPTQLDERRKVATERVKAFKTGVTFKTLALRTD